MTALDAYMGARGARLRAEIEALCFDRMPNEACGFLIQTERGVIPKECKNVAAEPIWTFRIHPNDYATAEAESEIIAVWHSHVYLRPDPSMADKTMAESANLPLMIVSVPMMQWASYEPIGWRAPLLGRPFVHGVLDCFSLIRNYYSERLNIELPDFERPDDWWKPTKNENGKEIPPTLNLYLDNFAKAGFRAVEEIQEHDVILMQLMSDYVPNHAAIYLSDGLIMHHVAERISNIEPYVANWGYYSKNTWGLVRHESFK